VPAGHYSRVVERLRPEAGEPGPILDLEGRELGRHKGLAHYTVGQRRGIGVATGTPLYVVALDPARRAVIVGVKDSLRGETIGLSEPNWLDGRPGPQGRRVMARHRANEAAVPARAFADDRVELDTPAFGIAPGQACVLYDGTRVIGGGWIDRVETAAAEVAAGSA